MARAKIREIGGPAEIRGVAAPVNLYERPADPAPSPLHDLANGLAALDQGFAGFMGKRRESQDKVDRIRGQAAFNKANGAAWAEAVKQGLVPADASPAFMEAYKTSQGNLAGLQLREKFQSAYLQWDGRNSGDPAKFQEFLGTFLAENIAVDDPYVLNGLNPHVEALFTDGYSTFSKERGEAAYKGAVDTAGAVAGETIQSGEADGLANETGTDYDAMWSSLMDERTKQLSTGIREADYDGTLVRTIVAEAVRSRNPELLKLLDRKLPGSEHAISSFPEFRDLRDKAIKELETASRQAEVDSDRAQAKADKIAEDNIMRGVMRTFAADPTAPISEDVIKQLERYNPKARAELVDMRKKLLEATAEEDPRELLEMSEDIRNGATEKDINQWLLDGRIRSRSTYEALLDRMEKYGKVRTDGSGILTSQTAKRYGNAIKDRTAPDGIIDFFGTRGMTDEGLEATQRFEMELMQWEQANPNASFIEREKAVNEIGTAILGNLPDPNAEVGADEVEPTALPEVVVPQTETPAGPEAAAGAAWNWLTGGGDTEEEASLPEVAPDAPVEGDGIQVESYTGDAPPALDTLPQDQRDFINSEAERLGVTPEEYNMGLWKELKKIVTGEEVTDDPLTTPYVDPSTTNSIPTDAVSAIENVLQDPPQMRTSSTASSQPEIRRASPILDLIGNTEGTDKRRGYNETLGYGAFTGGDVELTKMTLDEIEALQTKMLKHPDNKWPSSALGRYQIIRTTLRTLRKDMGLTGKELFDEDMQDRMAMALLERRGLSKFLSGKMTEDKFIEGLSAEWASLPKASGKGTYKGQRVGTSVAGLRGALAALKSNKTLVAGGGSDFLSDLVARPLSESQVSEILSPPKAYSKIPAAEVAQFLEWNSDPVANHESNLKSVDTELAEVVRLAQKKSGLKFVVGSGLRDDDLQKKAVEWGWSKTNDSDHEHGSAVDLWPIDEDGAVVFEEKQQRAIAKAMEQAAKELGIDLDIGANWKTPDLPHFAVKRKKAKA